MTITTEELLSWETPLQNPSKLRSTMLPYENTLLAILVNEVQALCSPNSPQTSQGEVARMIGVFLEDPMEVVGAILYIRRLGISCGFLFTAENVDGVLLASWLCSHKVLNDIPLSNRCISSSFGLGLDSLNALERQFMALMDFRLGFSELEVQNIKKEFRSLLPSTL